MPIIEVENVGFSAGGHSILSNVNFRVERGDYMGIIGPNGGGKTTLIKIILGLIKPTEGKVTRDWTGCGYVPQRAAERAADFPATVEEVVRSGRRIKKGKRASKEDLLAVDKALEVSGMSEYRNRLMGPLSGGERQKAFIARALAGEPEVIILDEPSAGVDVASQGRIYSFLDELNEKGITIIFISHDLDVVANEAKSILCLNKTSTCFGSPQEAMSEEKMEKLYGRKVKFFSHDH